MAAVALVVGAVIWLPLVHLFFAKPSGDFYLAKGVSAKARELAAQQMATWRNPESLRRELDRMRATNAEWDFMGRCFLVWSLANLGLREPAAKPAYLPVMDQIIEETLRLERERGMFVFLMPYAQARPFEAKPARSLFIDGEIALMLAARRALEEKPEYLPLLRERVDQIVTNISNRPTLVAESYPNECWTFDHAVALAAVALADRLDGADHSGLRDRWVAMAKTNLTHHETGLLVSSFTRTREPLDGPEGSSIWLIAHCLQVLDEPFARDQYERARKELGRTILGFSYAREWPVSWRGEADVDSGPIIPGLNISPGSSGLAFVGATAFGDTDFTASLAATLDFAAMPSRTDGRLRYCASNQVGDALMLYAATLGPLWRLIRVGSDHD